MKINKFLIPAASIVSIATIGLTACSNPKFVTKAIPTEKLNIVDEGKGAIKLNGLKDATEDLSEYNTLLVPKEVIQVSGFKYEKATTTKALECIEVIDFEENSACESFPSVTFQDLPNLTTIIFPEKLADLTNMGISFNTKLNRIDISRITGDLKFLWDGSRGFVDAQKNGKLVIRANQAEDAAKILDANKEELIGWTTEIK